MTNYAVYLLTGPDQATLPEALAVAGFTIAVVFGVLLLICVAIKIFSFIIGGIENSDLSDLLSQLMGGGAGARAGGIVLSATAEGVVSAFLVFRVGVITKRRLTAADGPERMSSIRRTSYREALALMRTSGFMQTVTDMMKQTTEAVASSVASSVADAAKSKVTAARNAMPFGRNRSSI